MRRSCSHFGRTVLLLFVPCAALPLYAQQAAVPQLTVQIVVTIQDKTGKRPPTITPQDIAVTVGKEKCEVIDVTPLSGERGALDLAILIDDALSFRLDVIPHELADFVRQLPADTRVSIWYAGGGVLKAAQGLTTDHELAAKALRAPLNLSSQPAGIYRALLNVESNFPTNANRHAVLLVSSGLDLTPGTVVLDPSENSDLERTVRFAQASGITVHTLSGSIGLVTGSPNPVSGNRRGYEAIARGFLTRLANDTGGQELPSGAGSPADYSHQLQQLTTVLQQQYQLSLRVRPGKKAGFQNLRLSTPLAGVRLTAPSSVYVPAAN